MVTASQLRSLDAKLDALAAAIDTDNQPIRVVVFSGETPDFALQRHRELRPDHAGRAVRFEYRNVPRADVEEMLAVHTDAEIRAVIERIWAKNDRLGDYVRRKRAGEEVV